MTIKSLLLGSAAAVAVVGGAQAADLSVAEPVEYVKVCDYFGAGYWYIPGTDTCIKISGFVEENAYFHSNDPVSTISWVNYYRGRAFSHSASHSSTWDFTHVVQMDIDTKSETEYGVLEGLISFGNGGKGYSSYGLGSDGAYVSLGGFKAGAYQYGAFHPEYGFTDQNGPVYNNIYATFGYDALETVQMSWASGGMSAAIGVSDPSSSEFFNYGVGNPVSPSAPLITGNVGFGSKDVMFNVAAGFVTNDSGYGSSWGIDGRADITLGANDKIEANAAFGDNYFTQGDAAVANYSPSLGTNNGYSFLLGWQHNLSKTLTLALDGSWEKFSGSSDTAYAFSGDLIWSPVTNFSVIAAATYENNVHWEGETSWEASLTARRSW